MVIVGAVEVEVVVVVVVVEVGVVSSGGSGSGSGGCISGVVGVVLVEVEVVGQWR